MIRVVIVVSFYLGVLWWGKISVRVVVGSGVGVCVVKSRRRIGGGFVVGEWF